MTFDFITFMAVAVGVAIVLLAYFELVGADSDVPGDGMIVFAATVSVLSGVFGGGVTGTDNLKNQSNEALASAMGVVDVTDDAYATHLIDEVQYTCEGVPSLDDVRDAVRAEVGLFTSDDLIAEAAERVTADLLADDFICTKYDAPRVVAGEESRQYVRGPGHRWGDR